MEARNINLLKFIEDAKQFVIPIYQRKYSWEIEQCDQLWRDIIRAGKTEFGGHFIGSIVYVADSDAHNASLLVIDGQQRLTTLTLLITALANTVGEKESLDRFSQKKLRGYYLTNPLESGDLSYKLILSDVDRETLFSIVDGHNFPDKYSFRVKQNYKFFEEKLENIDGEIEIVCRGLSKLLVVYVALSRKEDNPQLIFESMNSTGRELGQADLIRNFILMGLEPDLQTKLYKQFWRPMETAFGQEAYGTHFDKFMRHYLTVKTESIPRRDKVYDVFKKYAYSSEIVKAGVESLVTDIRDFARYYCAMALGTESNPNLKMAFHDLRELKVDVAYPFLLELYSDYSLGVLSEDDFLEAVRLVEAYVFRRAICAIPTNSLNKTFATFTKALKKDHYLESIKAHFLLMSSYRRFPTDDEFKRDIQTRDLYNFRSRSYWLRRFENYGRKERVPVDEYTVEHIMPQSEQLSNAWKVALGEEWERVHQTYLHTLGNLTLTGYNSEYSNRSFKDKCSRKGGFKESPLRINAGLGELNDWNEKTIKSRAIKLAMRAVSVWPAPAVATDALEMYQPQTRETAIYSIEDHPYLANSPTRELFEAFRREVLRLDPCVNEEFLKLYVAYKAETNFVDVVPQAKQLRLSLNMAFSEINDPREMCMDISGTGRWGNGDVEVKFNTVDDLPYILGLVRQSLECQLGNGEEV